MIRCIEHTQLDKKKWDHCIRNSYNESIFVYSWYLDALCEGWKGYVLNDYEAVFPIAVNYKFKIAYIYQPFFSRYFGVYTAKQPSETLVDEFISTIFSTYKNAQFCLHESNNTTIGLVRKTERLFQYLLISADYETLFKAYSENVKRNLKKAIKNNLRVETFISPEEIVALFKKTKGNELELFQPGHYQSLIRLMHTCLSQKNGFTIAVYKGTELYAAAFFMYSNNRFTYLKSGITNEGKDSGAMHFLMDRFIELNAGKGKTLDFGGSSVESVARFYKSFGARDCVYLQIEKGTFFKLLKWFKSFKL
jgi:hypothetical protein